MKQRITLKVHKELFIFDSFGQANSFMDAYYFANPKGPIDFTITAKEVKE